MLIVRTDEQLFQSMTKSQIPDDTQVIFVADMFPADYVGGAELTLDALISTAPVKVAQVHARDVTIDTIKQGIDCHWVFGNYTSLDPKLIPILAGNVQYSIVECDYKFCIYRSPEKHQEQSGHPCDCATSKHAALITSFMSAADQIWWMSEKQREVYLAKFPFLIDYSQAVLSSVFDDKFFAVIAHLREKHANASRDKWLVFESSSWIKGTAQSKHEAELHGLDYELVSNLSYDDMLEKLATSKGLVYYPPGMDTCPRMVIEAKLLGCELLINDNVQHRHEDWFDDQSVTSIEDYLMTAPATFWRTTSKHMDRSYTLSGYATTYNCVKQEYPFAACVESMLGFCDEVVVVDGGSTDGTMEALRALQSKYAIPGAEEYFKQHQTLAGDEAADTNVASRLKVHSVPRDWTDERSALFDGQQKAEARLRCVGDFCWQMDVDEVVRSEDGAKIRDLIRNFPKSVPMLSLPVIEYWGGFDKVRIDINPWKWRCSRNSPRITHGVPKHLRAKDDQQRDIALPGTDGCDPIDALTGDPIVFLGFLTQDMEQSRQLALRGDQEALQKYELWLEQVVANVPSVFHASWLDIERKIRLYRDFWSRHWNSLSGDTLEDTADKNMFFDKPWSAVTNDDITLLARELRSKTGGHVWHSKWDPSARSTPHMKLSKIHPPAELEAVYSHIKQTT